MVDLFVAIVRRKLGQIGIGGIVGSIGHYAAKRADPLPLDVEVLDGYDMARGGIGSNRFELSYRLGVAGATRGVDRKMPATSLVFRPVDGLANPNIGVEPLGVALHHLQSEEATVAMPEDENLVLAKLPTRPARHFLDIVYHPLGREG